MKKGGLGPIATDLDGLLRDLAVLMRPARIWTSAFADRGTDLRRQVARLESEAREHLPLPDFTRPLRTWDDADAVLAWIIDEPRGMECGAVFTVHAPLLMWLCRQFDRWREAGAPVPIDVRVARFGDVVVEWPKGFLFASGGRISCQGKVPAPTVPHKKKV